MACNKEFKTERAFANHETSKKHRDNIEKLKIEMQDEEHLYQQDENSQETVETAIEITKEETEDDTSARMEDLQAIGNKNKTNKTKNKKDAKKVKQTILLNSDEDNNCEENLEEVVSKLDISCSYDKEDDNWNTSNKKSIKKSKTKNKTNQKKSILSEPQSVKKNTEPEIFPKTVSKSNNDLDSETTQHVCVTCKSKFESKNKLFSHLKLTNHGVYIPKTKVTNDENAKSKKAKGKRN